MGVILLRLLQRIKLALHALGRTSCSQVPRVIFADMPAIAPTNPHGLPIASAAEPNHGELTEGLVE